MAEYASIVEMTKEQFDEYAEMLESGDRTQRRTAERNLDGMVDNDDWQDEDFREVCEFEEWKPE
jgi:hypothetical protein